MDGSEVCIGCGFGSELGELKPWTDNDDESWWVHEVCLENRELLRKCRRG